MDMKLIYILFYLDICLYHQALYTNQSGLKKDLTGLQLIFIGIGATIGAGIFVVTGSTYRKSYFSGLT